MKVRNVSRPVALVAGVLFLLLGLAVPADAATAATGTTHHRVRPAAAPPVTYRTVTAKDGTRQRFITAVRGKELVDRSGRPAPVLAPEPDSAVHPMLEVTSCQPGLPVNITHDGGQHTCYWQRGSRAITITRLTNLFAGKWTGSLYYETATQCVSNPFSAYERRPVDPTSHHCLLSIDHSV